jgi:hypothetical protein
MGNQPDKIFENCISFNNNLSDLPNSAGLVLFADSQDLPILLLACANIRRNAKNKLAEQIDPSTTLRVNRAGPSTSLPSTMLGTGRAGATKKADLKSITAKIYYKTCPCKFRLAIAHWQAVRKIFGQNYKDYITFVRPAYIKTNLDEKTPSFSITRKPAFKDGAKILGPLPGQRSATVFLKALEDAFRLCKRNDLVNNPEQAESCPYIQMDACSGVCGRKVSIEDYKNIIENAFEAGANPKAVIEKLKGQMQIASAELSFEIAAQLKKRIEKLSVLTKKTYRWTGDLKKLKIIHIDKSFKIKPEGAKKKVQAYAVFVMDFFNITDLGDFTRENPDLTYEAISKNICNCPENVSDEIIERFSIVSYFLYRSKPTGAWINASAGVDKHEFSRLFLDTD